MNMNQDKNGHYSFRKLSVGLASVLIGLSFVNAKTVNADTVKGNSEPEENVAQAKIQKPESMQSAILKDTNEIANSMQRTPQTSPNLNSNTSAVKPVQNNRKDDLNTKVLNGTDENKVSNVQNESKIDNTKNAANENLRGKSGQSSNKTLDNTNSIGTSKKVGKDTKDQSNTQTLKIDKNMRVLDSKQLEMNLTDGQKQYAWDDTNDAAMIARGYHKTAAGWTKLQEGKDYNAVAKSSNVKFLKDGTNDEMGTIQRTINQSLWAPEVINTTIDKSNVIQGNKILIGAVPFLHKDGRSVQWVQNNSAVPGIHDVYNNGNEEKIGSIQAYFVGQELDYFFIVESNEKYTSDLSFNSSAAGLQLNDPNWGTYSSLTGTTKDNPEQEVMLTPQGSKYSVISTVDPNYKEIWYEPGTANQPDGGIGLSGASSIDAWIYNGYHGNSTTTLTDTKDYVNEKVLKLHNNAGLEITPDFSVVNWWCAPIDGTKTLNYAKEGELPRYVSVNLGDNLSSQELFNKTKDNQFTYSRQSNGDVLLCYKLHANNLKVPDPNWIKDQIMNSYWWSITNPSNKQQILDHTMDVYKQRNYQVLQWALNPHVAVNNPSNKSFTLFLSNVTPGDEGKIPVNNTSTTYNASGSPISVDTSLYRTYHVQYKDTESGKIVNNDTIITQTGAQVSYTPQNMDGYMLAPGQITSIDFTVPKDEKKDPDPIVINVMPETYDNIVDALRHMKGVNFKIENEYKYVDPNDKNAAAEFDKQNKAQLDKLRDLIQQHQVDLEIWQSKVNNYNKARNDFINKLKGEHLWPDNAVDPSTINNGLKLDHENSTVTGKVLQNDVGTLTTSNDANRLLIFNATKTNVDGNFLEMDYSNLKNASLNGTKIDKITVTFSNLKNAGVWSNNNTIRQGGNSVLDGWFTGNIKSVDIDIAFYDKDGHQLSTKGSYITIDSLNGGYGGRDECAKILDGDGIQMPETSIIVHNGNDLYADHSNADDDNAKQYWGDEIYNKYIAGVGYGKWDNMSSPLKIFGAGVGKINGDTIKYCSYVSDDQDSWQTAVSVNMPAMSFDATGTKLPIMNIDKNSSTMPNKGDDDGFVLYVSTKYKNEDGDLIAKDTNTSSTRHYRVYEEDPDHNGGLNPKLVNDTVINVDGLDMATPVNSNNTSLHDLSTFSGYTRQLEDGVTIKDGHAETIQDVANYTHANRHILFIANPQSVIYKFVDDENKDSQGQPQQVGQDIKLTGVTDQTIDTGLTLPKNYTLATLKQLPATYKLGINNSQVLIHLVHGKTNVANPKDLQDTSSRTIIIHFPAGHGNIETIVQTIGFKRNGYFDQVFGRNVYTSNWGLDATNTNVKVTGQLPGDTTKYTAYALNPNGKDIDFAAVPLPKVSGYKVKIYPVKSGVNPTAFLISFVALPNVNQDAPTNLDQKQTQDPSTPNAVVSVDPKQDTKTADLDTKDSNSSSQLVLVENADEMQHVNATIDTTWYIQDSNLNDLIMPYIVSNSSHKLHLPRFNKYTLHIIKRVSNKDSVSFVYINSNRAVKYIFNIKIEKGKYLLSIAQIENENIRPLKQVEFEDYNQLIKLIIKVVNK